MTIATMVYVSVIAALVLNACKNVTPYFPIEISRCLACSEESAVYFVVGVYVYVLMALVTNARATAGRVLCFVGVSILLFFNDRVSWTAHMLGVAIATVGVILHVIRDQNNRGAQLCIAAAAVYSARLVAKIAAVVIWENMFYSLLNNSTAYVTEIFSKSMLLMQTGQCTNPHTLDAFAYVGGVMQWITVALMMMALTSPIED